jgi:hypothetical protein
MRENIKLGNIKCSVCCSVRGTRIGAVFTYFVYPRLIIVLEDFYDNSDANLFIKTTTLITFYTENVWKFLYKETICAPISSPN